MEPVTSRLAMAAAPMTPESSPTSAGTICGWVAMEGRLVMRKTIVPVLPRGDEAGQPFTMRTRTERRHIAGTTRTLLLGCSS